MEGTPVDTVTIVSPAAVGAKGTRVELPWRDLATHALPPGKLTLEWTLVGERPVGTAVEIPWCAGRGALVIDGASTALVDGPAIVRYTGAETRLHTWELAIEVSAYEKRVACGFAPRVGKAVWTRSGLSTRSFPSPSWEKGGGMATVFVPSQHDEHPPLLVGVHPWNGSRVTYAAYATLLEAAERERVVLVMPSALGNSLYVAASEDEVMRATDAVMADLAVDPRRVSIWGASMGGQGACTIGWHRPGRFVNVTSFFGDARFDVTSYVRSILPTEADAHAVNPLDVIDNARHQATWLIHGDSDRTAPIRESDTLAAALRTRGFVVQYDRVPGRGHEGSLVTDRAAEIVARAAKAVRVDKPVRVSFRSVRPRDTSAYGVTLERAAAGDAFVDLERTNAGTLVVHAAENVRRIVLAKDAWPEARVDVDGRKEVAVVWSER